MFKKEKVFTISKLAERVGFEPTKQLIVYLLSRQMLSATQPPLHISFLIYQKNL